MSWYDDDESEYEGKNETEKLVMALSGRWTDEMEAYDESVLYEDLDVSHKDTCDMCEESLKTLEEQINVMAKLENENKELLCTFSHLQSEVTLLNSKLNNMSDSLKKMKSRADMVREDEDTEVFYQSDNKQCRVFEEKNDQHVHT